MVHRRLAFLLIDGIGDVALPQLEDLTPLQVARTPVLDALAACGASGLMDSVEPGRACGSDTAHLGIFGYDPRQTYRGRGAFESMGAGCQVEPGDIAFKCNFATMDNESGLVIHRRVDRTFDDEGPELCAFLDGVELPDYPEHRVQVRYATEHRCGVVIKGPSLTDEISGTDPLKDNLPLRQCTSLDASPEGELTTALINYVSGVFRNRLKDHPINQQRAAAGKNVANVILMRGCGMQLRLPCFAGRHGLRACIVAPTKILGGLGMTLGMEWLPVDGTTGSYDSQFHLKAHAVCRALCRSEAPFEFGFLHVKAVDDCGHDRLWGLRVRYLELMDRLTGIIVRLLHEAEQEQPYVKFSVLVTGDHSTPVMFGDHSHEPVPLAIADVADVVSTLGQGTVTQFDLGPLPALTQHSHVSESELHAQAQEQKLLHYTFSSDAVRADSSSNRSKDACTRREDYSAGEVWGGKQEMRETESCDAADVIVQGVGNYETCCKFDEISAARGQLGRFPSSELMPLVRALLSA